MREILFRGKLKADNLPNKKGDWVFGHFVILKDGDRDIPYIYGFGEVYPATVGQFTGLLDKNNKKIFEGDIVRYIYEPGQNAWNANQLSIIMWKTVGFYMEGIFGTNKYACMTGYLVSIPHGDGKFFEVIGNIHDNPEMIERADMPIANDVFQPVLQPAAPENFELMHS